MTFENDETLQIYIEESLEHLDDIENDFLAIEATGADIDEELVNKVYRAAHSIKGGAGFMGLNNIKNLTHEMENILGKIRSREMIPNPEIINILLSASDTLKSLINNINESNDMDVSGHIEALSMLLSGSLPQGEKETVKNSKDIMFSDGRTAFTVSEYDISNAEKEGKNIYLVEYDLLHDVHNKGKNPLDVLKEMQDCGDIIESRVEIAAVGTLEDEDAPVRIPFIILFASILKPEDINVLFEIDERYILFLNDELILGPISDLSVDGFEQESSVDEEPEQEVYVNEEPDETKAGETEDLEEEMAEMESEVFVEKVKPPETKKSLESDGDTAKAMAGGDTSLRVHVSLLDSLMNLAGELVLSRNQLLQAMSSHDQRSSEIAGQRIDLITSELQEAIMATRMQPIGNVFNKFPRVVRDLSRTLKKEVELFLEGKDVELDKTIIESINDPLTHLVRNSVDHGIETPAQRRKTGKASEGKVFLKAYHEAGQVNIEITDDGKGLNGNALAEAAMAKGLISEEQAKAMSDKEKVHLIFMPGFSTAEKVTDVSGRGVGMDVVKTNLDKLGGIVDIDTEIGKGTKIRIKLPLTLAIIPTQIISSGGERYAIPQVNMEELLRIPADKIKERVEKVGDADVVRLRGKLLPLIRLSDVIGIERTYFDEESSAESEDRRNNIADRRSFKSGQKAPVNTEVDLNVRDSDDRRKSAASAVNIVVVSTGALKYGLVVDQLHDSEEIVVKPLGRHLKNCKGYAGATIMGDGRVALILDITGLSRMADLISFEGNERAGEIQREAVKKDEDVQSLLIFRNAPEEQFAVPLGLVSRIEKVKSYDVEMVGGKRIMQCRGETLPLMSIEEAADVTPMDDREDLLVIVFSISGREIGVLAASPIDAFEVKTKFDETTLRQTGIMGSAIIEGKITQLVDIFGLIEAVKPDWFEEREPVTEPDGTAPTILYAEDSAFFRTQVKGFLEDDGYNVVEAEDGALAWDLLCESGDGIDLIVTDIEMPNMNGFELTQKVKGDERFSALPVIAMTTMAGDDDVTRGSEVGIDDYQIKLDREKLLESIHGFLSK